MVMQKQAEDGRFTDNNNSGMISCQRCSSSRAAANLRLQCHVSQAPVNCSLELCQHTSRHPDQTRAACNHRTLLVLITEKKLKASYSIKAN